MEEQRGESVDELRLEQVIVSVPNTVEEAFPELFEVFFGETLLGRKPRFEEETESFVSGCLVAIC